jgi:hypothetical protein
MDRRPSSTGWASVQRMTNGRPAALQRSVLVARRAAAVFSVAALGVGTCGAPVGRGPRRRFEATGRIKNRPVRCTQRHELILSEHSRDGHGRLGVTS